MASSRLLDQLIYDIACGDQDALAHLYGLTSPAVYAYALSIVKNSYDAEDVLQDTYIRIHSSAPSYISQHKPMAWILTITKNLSLKALKAREKAASILCQEWDGATVSDPDQRLLIKACLDQLSSEERQIVVMHAVAAMKHRQIAEFMGLKVSTVLSKYHRAIQKIRSYI